MTRYEALGERPDIELPPGWRLCISEKVTELCEAWAMAVRERNEARQRLRGAVALLTDPNAFWDAIYPHITEAGPDLCFKDCERITSWLAAHLAGESGAR